MMTSATKSERTRLDWSFQNDVDQISIPITPADEAKNHAPFVLQVPELPHSGPKKLDQRAKWLQHGAIGVILGECRFKVAKWDQGNDMCIKASCALLAVVFGFGVNMGHATTIDTFDTMPDGEISRLTAGTNSILTQENDSAIGGERVLNHAAIGGIAILGYENGALAFENLGIFGGPQIMQNVLTITYDGILGSQAPGGGLGVDLSDGGLSDRFIFSGTLVRGQSTRPELPADIRIGARAYDDDYSAGLVGGTGGVPLGPVGSGAEPLDFTAEILFSSLGLASAEPFSLAETDVVQFLIYFNSASTGKLLLDEICTGSASGCVDTPTGAAPTVPLPASAWLMLAGLGTLIGLRLRG